MFLHRHIGSALICLAATLVACTPQAVREAQDVVAQADSLWSAGQMYGREAGDSATLAQAYETLNNIPSSLSPQLSTTFAHACYHYGRLLRERENPAAAMEAFIHATHSRTHDYHIPPIPPALTYRITKSDGNAILDGRIKGTTKAMYSVFLHRTDWNGKANHSSKGCMIIDGRQWRNVETQLKKSSNIFLKINR